MSGPVVPSAGDGHLDQPADTSTMRGMMSTSGAGNNPSTWVGVYVVGAVLFTVLFRRMFREYL
jgi:hypothetical protein